jgi:DNA repair exonuclease SbcCD ATPase subunit
MGWVLAFLLFLTAGLLALFLANTRGERNALLARVAELGPEAARSAPLQIERDKYVEAFEGLRKQAQEVAAADAKKERLLAKCEQARVLLKAERDKFAGAYESLREKAEAVVAADAEKERLLAQCSQERGLLKAERDKLAGAYSTIAARMEGVLDADAERDRVLAEITEKTAEFDAARAVREAEVATLESQLVPLRREHRTLSDEASLREMGYYKSHYGFATSERYQKAIDENYAKQKAMLRDKEAATCRKEWTVDGSLEKGRKQTEKYLTLMVRAFNGECDSAIAKVKPTNYQTMENRVEKAFETLNKLGEMYYCAISEEYKDLRLEELRLEHEHAMKVQAEREEQRAIKEEMRQQAIAAREIEKAQQEAEREEKQYETALAKARAEFEKASAAKQEEMQAKLAELEQMVAEAHANKERAISRAQQTRAGHVYVISNIGSFGTNVYKIGMTRRLDPMDRIWELSDASVPFDFDVHAIIYTDDAPALEAELHDRFRDRRVNAINERKEYFYATMAEIAEVVRERFAEIELTMAAEAAEFLQSVAYHRENGRPFVQQRQFAFAELGENK